MGRYIIRRSLWVVLVLLIITVVTFSIFYLLPSVDPAIAFSGRQPTPEIIAEVREQFGLNKPIHVQYGLFVQRLVFGDQYGWPGFGLSFDTRSPIREEIFDRLGVTVMLALGGAVFWLTLGIPIGIISALKRGTKIDRAAMGFALVGVSAPVFWLALLFLFVFWKKLGIAAGTGYVPFSDNPLSWANHMVMPWAVLSLLFAAFYARMLRGTMIETMNEDYIRTARAKGLTERRVIFRHGLRSSLTPIVTQFGLDLGGLLGGAIVTESIFNLRGLGSYSIGAVRDGNLPVILAVTVFTAFFITIFNLLVDIAYAYLDPRVRYS
ncbi:MAG: ABC transporter permease [Actinobacteria bacterium]|nr:ABC transporter permease [Actinomycetota bacterium]